MSLLLRRLRVGKPAWVRSSLILSNGFSSSLLQTPPCFILSADYCGTRFADGGKLVVSYANDTHPTFLEKKVSLELLSYRKKITIGASHGWVATLKDDGILRLQDDLNPVASDSHPKRISLPPLVTLPHCQTQTVTNVSMSSSSPEDEDCVVAVKFLGPQLSFCRPAQSNSQWTNIRIQNPCFYSSRVMFSKKDEMFHMPGSGGHLIASWDLCTHNPNPKFQTLRFQNLPKLTKTKRDLMESCTKSEHLVESPSTGDTFLLKWYKKTENFSKGMAFMKTKALMVFKLDGEGNALYTQDIGSLCIFLSKSEPFCVPALLFPGMCHNHVIIFDVDEIAMFDLAESSFISEIAHFAAPYHIPPQDIDD